MKTTLLVLACMLLACQAVTLSPHHQPATLDASFVEGKLMNETANTTATTNTTAVSFTCSDTNPCKNNGTCASGVCTCLTGFSGSQCEKTPCSDVVCDRTSKCVDGKCVFDACANVYCQNGGLCNGGICTCANNFTGPFCQNHPCAAVKCQNGGVCTNNGTCYCLNNYFGQFCENSPCNNVTCMNGGKCLYGSCMCMPEWSGARCERPSEAARDFKVYVDTINSLSANITALQQKMVNLHNNTRPGRITEAIAPIIRELQDKIVTSAREASKADFMTPKVIGVKPVTQKDLRMPNTPMENAKIYEDKDLAYKKAREIKDKKLVSALDLVNKFDQQRAIDSVVIAKDVPGAEYFKGPFGFVEMQTNYDIEQGNALIEEELTAARKEYDDLQSFIMG